MAGLVVDSSLEERILESVEEGSGSKNILAACFYGSGIHKHTGRKADINVLLILPEYSEKIASRLVETHEIDLAALLVDQHVFESDVEYGGFGEIAAEILALPYQPWINRSYLEEMDVRWKKRSIIELLRNIILQYPELAMEILIKPEYFMYETLRKRVKIFPPLRYRLLNAFGRESRGKSIEFIMNGYLKALDKLEQERYVALSDSHVTINKDFIQKAKQEQNRLSNILLSVRKAILPYVEGASSRIRTILSQDERLIKWRARAGREAEGGFTDALAETEKYLLIPTPLGPVPLSDKTNIQDFVRKRVPGGEELETRIEEMGGVLNSVFLLTIKRNHETQRIVVKKFEDWLGFKWFPLALWTLGTKSFAVLGRTRLEREYSTNQFLSKRGFTVPTVLYVSLKNRLVFQDFVEGEKLSEVVKRIVSSPREDAAANAETIRTVGEEIARVHSSSIALGDCKPENILITNDRRICLLDLEQATRNGNQSWDIAEFLYYSGHYILPIHSDEAARIITSSFIRGYLESGGKKEVVRKAASPRYTKVFSVFTLPHVILQVSSICRKAGEEK